MTLVNEKARILRNDCVGPRLYIMTVSSPVIAQAIEPGQFVHMKVPRMEDHILRRPFSIYDVDVEKGTLDILYQVVGFSTDHMTRLECGLECELVGPVGRGWMPVKDAERVLLVGGGVGAAPLFMLCERLVNEGKHVDVVLGAQTADALVCRDRYEALLTQGAGCSAHALRCATDDGSFGRAGFCTSLVTEALEEARTCDAAYDYVAVCGPEPLMKIVSGIAADFDTPCELSLEKRMACGVGACLSCVVDTVGGKKRACVDGPVFNALDIIW